MPVEVRYDEFTGDITANRLVKAECGCDSARQDAAALPGFPRRSARIGARLEIAALDLSGTIDDLLERIGALAQRVRALRAELPEKRAA